jgi:hypothetical protein
VPRYLQWGDNPVMPLNYLIFDASDDDHGNGTWDAMASVKAGELPRVLAEVEAVLTQAHASGLAPLGPMDEGGAWDAHTQTTWDGEWATVTLTLTGPWSWGHALMTELGAADD